MILNVFYFVSEFSCHLDNKYSFLGGWSVGQLLNRINAQIFNPKTRVKVREHDVCTIKQLFQGKIWSLLGLILHGILYLWVWSC